VDEGELLGAVGSEEEEEESESEYETESEEEEFGRRMLKPVFVTKKERETIAEREAFEREEVEAMKKEKVRDVLVSSLKY
jgi:microfibrillar-associated protein 1